MYVFLFAIHNLGSQQPSYNKYACVFSIANVTDRAVPSPACLLFSGTQGD